MAEIFNQIECYEVKYICDVCKQGLMKPRGVMLTSEPPQYPHDCTNCKHTEDFYCVYPCIAHSYTGEAVY